MENLFGEAVVVTAEDIDKLARPPENFLLWVWSKFVERKGRLVNLMAQAVIRAGRAKTVAEALQYLADVSPTVMSQVKITHTDLSGRDNHRPDQRLRDLMQAGSGERGRFGSEIRRLGVVSHSAVPEVLAGQLPDPEIIRCLRQRTAGGVEQLSLFTERARDEARQLDLAISDGVQLGARYLDGFGPDGRPHPDYIHALKACWQDARAALSGSDDYLRQYTHVRRYLAELYELLTPLFGGYVYDLIKCHQSGETPFLDFLTLLSWVSAWHYSETRGPLYFAREIRLLPPHYGSFGRVDALRVVAIDGQPPNRLTSSRRSALAALLGRRWPSVGKALLALCRVYGKNIQVEIADWKFSVGDALTPDAIIKPSEVAEKPLLPHVAQIQRYLVLASLDYHLLTRRTQSDEVWTENGYFRQGALYYWLPSAAEPLVHTVTMSSSEQKEVFKQIVVWRWPKAQRQAVVRTLTNGLVGHLLGLLNHTSRSEIVTDNHSRSESTAPLLGVPGLLEQVVARHRTYFDGGEIIEIVGRNRHGEPLLAMHLDRLLTAIIQDQVVRRGWSEERGGFIKCLAPNHDDHNPSMHVSIPAGIFKCFSCGVFGRLVLSATKDSLTPERRLSERVWQEKKRTRSLIIPPEHDAIMSRAQAYFQSVFWGSAAERYLVRERRLEADLCFALGTGFGSADVLGVLLDEGYSYEQLIQYGFVAISSKISQGRSLWPCLQKRGFAPAEIRCQVGEKEGKPRFGWPYFPLQNRATWPLTLGGKATNFYGRATWPCDRQFTHRKLSVEHTGLPHGAFNFARAESSGEDIYITEAAIDAITMEMLGFTPVVAVIGANNVAIIETVAALGKRRISLAFDRDETGRRSTWQAEQRLYQAGFTGEVVDLSREFFAVFSPIVEECKDYNQWWQIVQEDFSLKL